MIKPLLACAAALASTGCQKKPSAAPPPPPGAIDAAVGGADAEAAAPSEDELRAGKRTGLGGPDEQPEVATEDFARALVTGQAPWSRVVSPSSGVVELRADGAVGRRCGAEVDAALSKLGAVMMTKIDHPEAGYELACDNRDLNGAEPRSATCSLDGPDGLGYDLVFVPDPTLGLRLVGVTIIDGTGTVTDPQLDAFDVEIARTGKLCP